MIITLGLFLCVIEVSLVVTFLRCFISKSSVKSVLMKITSPSLGSKFFHYRLNSSASEPPMASVVLLLPKLLVNRELGLVTLDSLAKYH